MTISTQKNKISGVGLPILKTPQPCIVSVFWSNFFRSVNMVNVKCAIIRIPAFFAFATKSIHDCNFLVPIILSFVCGISCFIPKILLAFFRTESCRSGFTAHVTFARLLPTMSKITFLITILSRAFFKAINMHHALLAAMQTGYFFRCFFYIKKHIVIYGKSQAKKYFEIAKNRIKPELQQQLLNI